MRITEIFALGHYGDSDDCCGGDYSYGYGYDYGYEIRNRPGGDTADFNDRDTPLPRLKGSRTYLQ